MKGRRWVSDVLICPLYKASEPQCIFCDGEEFSSLRISFPDNAGRDAYMAKYCDKDYEDCPVYDVFIKHI